MDIEKVIQGCIQNNRRSQNYLYEQYYPLMHNIATRYCTNSSQVSSLINAGFYKVFKNIQKYDAEYALATWMRNIMVNTCIDEYRKNSAIPMTMTLEEEIAPRVEIDRNTGEEHLQEQDVLELISQLNDVPRAVFNMYAIDGYSHKDIGEKLNISPGVCRWHLHQARTELKKKLESQVAKENKSREVVR